MSEKDGGAAFPGQVLKEGPLGDGMSFEDGMSLRDWYAGMALVGLSSTTLEPPPADYTDAVERRARLAFDLAEAMLAERTRTSEEKQE